jgi:MMPL family
MATCVATRLRASARERDAMKAARFERLALASATHPRRTIGGWVAAVLIAVVAIGTLLGGALATEANPTNNPQSPRAKDVREAAFPAGSDAAITDIIVVSSPRYTVESPRFRGFVRTLAGEVRGAKDVETVRSYLGARDPSLVSKDRHATMVQFAMPDESDTGIDDVISAVQQADAKSGFAVTVTGQGRATTTSTNCRRTTCGRVSCSSACRRR